MSAADQQKSIYAFIGQRIRERRKLLKLSQTELADLMGFSYQQMQKYESGASHVSAGKLLVFAQILNVPPAYFFEGIQLDVGGAMDATLIRRSEQKRFQVLLVEDNPADVILFKKALSECDTDVDVRTSHDVEAAMDYLVNHETKYHQDLPDLVVLDLSLPKRSGMDLLKTIKADIEMRKLPVIVLTNSISMNDMMEAYRLGAAGFIQKSVELKDYMECMAVVVKYWAKTVALPRG